MKILITYADGSTKKYEPIAMESQHGDVLSFLLRPKLPTVGLPYSERINWSRVRSITNLEVAEL